MPRPRAGREPGWGTGGLPHSPLPSPQLMQQQAALVAAHSAYLSPMATMAAVQMQHMAAINANGLIATPITPSSGMAWARLGKGAKRGRGRERHRVLLREASGSRRDSGVRVAYFLPSARRLPDWFSACVCVCVSAPLLCPCRFLLPRNQHPSCHRCHACLCHSGCPGRQRLQPGAYSAHWAACP